MKIKTFLVDSFTNTAFKGNPAGVCLLEEPLADHVLQSIAAEINASETAFLIKDPSKADHYQICYYSPSVEVDFCGHATVASSKVFFEIFGSQAVSFTTRKGLELSARKQNEKAILHFPLFQLEQREATQQLLNALGINSYKYYGFNPDLNMAFIELEDKQAVLNISPDFPAMLKADDKIKEAVVTARSTDNDYDFYSRCFCPGLGINEDPVTGAIHSVLTPYWQKKLGKNKLRSYQCSARGGYLDLEVLNDKILEISADAVIMLEGELRLP